MMEANANLMKMLRIQSSILATRRDANRILAARIRLQGSINCIPFILLLKMPLNAIQAAS